MHIFRKSVLFLSLFFIFSYVEGYVGHRLIYRHLKAFQTLDEKRDFPNYLSGKLPSKYTRLPSLNEKEISIENEVRKFTPKGTAPEFAIPGDSTEETIWQRSILYVHFLITAGCIYKSISSMQLISYSDFLGLFGAVSFSVILGDFATGVFHWAVDNYGNINTPVFGTVCAAFQGHHVTPWTITFRSFANNVYKICYATVPTLLLISQLNLSSLSTLFFTLFINWWMLSQEFHKYAHMKVPPSWIIYLQKYNIILSRKEHGLHHNSPFEGHYCILNGVCNHLLDKLQFFRYLEKFFYYLTGIPYKIIMILYNINKNSFFSFLFFFYPYEYN